MTNRLALAPDWQTADMSRLPSLLSAELHIWSLPLTLNHSQTELALGWLNDTQRNSYERRRGKQRKTAYLAGRYYLLRLLAAYSGCEPHQIQLAYTRLNKPYLSEASNSIHFNFTDTTIGHGESAASNGLLAFSRHAQVGVDIEHTSRQNNFANIAKSRFTKAEQQLIINRDGEIDSELFLHIWTRKEASGKATGQGINFKMNERELMQGDCAVLNYTDENQHPWRLVQLRISQELIGCVVHEGHDPLTIRAFNHLITD